MTTVTIVGVGLIGGSFALALRRHGFSGRILGVSSERTLAAARERGVIDQGLPLDQAVPQSDLVYLAQPIGRILELLPEVARLAPPTALVTDAGSTKAVIVARARECFSGGAMFLGGHPLAGKAERGVQVAEAGLFDGATYVLTPDGGTQADAVEEFRRWLQRFGARVILMSPETHDQVVAWTSHLPQMAATALGSILLDQLPSPSSWTVSGPGLRDATRLARSPYDLWRDICHTNAGNIDRALAAYIAQLEYLRQNLREAPLREEFSKAGEFSSRLQRFWENPS